MAQVDDEVAAASEKAARWLRAAKSHRRFDVARLCKTEIGQRQDHDAAIRDARRCVRLRRSISASVTRSGVSGNSSRSTPMALATALTRAGAKPASAPSLASLAPNGPCGSLLSTMWTSIGGDSA